jgi:hypothetical protein
MQQKTKVARDQMSEQKRANLNKEAKIRIQHNRMPVLAIVFVALVAVCLGAVLVM